MSQHEADRALQPLLALTGKRYPALAKFLAEANEEVLRDIRALARDVGDAIRQATQRGAREPWRM